MKFWILLWCLSPSLVLADIYKSVDADGHVTYSSAPIKGGKRIVLSAPVQSAPNHARAAPSPNDFPRVTDEAQKGRDGSRRKILDDELKVELGLLDTAKQSLQVAEAHRDADKVKGLTRQLELHQGNIAALKTELAKLK
ncbi:MAG: DUF4124 domain-containing protein [Nitrosomonadales bacterium]|jgi:hypothetical protein